MDLSHLRFSISDCRFEKFLVLTNCQSKSSNWQSAIVLSFRELKALARAFLSVLLAFLDARIARDQSRQFQCRPQIIVVFNQRASNPMANCAGLARRSAAGYINQHVEFVRSLRQMQRLANNHAQSLV